MDNLKVWVEGEAESGVTYLRLVDDAKLSRVLLAIVDAEGNVKGSSFLAGVTFEGRLEVYEDIRTDLGLQLDKDDRIEVVEI